jgi:hypothetical protein
MWSTRTDPGTSAPFRAAAEFRLEALVNCKACHTRIPKAAGQCPHCGRSERIGGFIDQSGTGSGVQQSASSPGPLSPSTLGPDASEDIDLDKEVELSLEDAMGGTGPSKSGGPRSAASTPKSRAKQSPKGTKAPRAKPRATRGKKPAGDKSEKINRSGESPASVGSACVQLDSEQLQHLIAERPDLLEAGLTVHVDDKGREIGARYDTEVGEIDLLARGGKGEWVVVLIACDAAGPELVSDALRRVGYVRKHLADTEESVRAIVLVEALDEELGYAATAVAETVGFKTWRVALTFEPLDL